MTHYRRTRAQSRPSHWHVINPNRDAVPEQEGPPLPPLLELERDEADAAATHQRYADMGCPYTADELEESARHFSARRRVLSESTGQEGGNRS